MDTIKTEPHDGSCGHCKTSVPLDAYVCAGCGAYWGFENGCRTRQELYDTSIAEIRFFFRVVMALLVICLVPPLFDKSGWGVLFMVVVVTTLTFGAPLWLLIGNRMRSIIFLWY